MLNLLARIEIETPILNEEAWNAWVRKGQFRDRMRTRRLKIVASIVLALFVIIGALYEMLTRI